MIITYLKCTGIAFPGQVARPSRQEQQCVKTSYYRGILMKLYDFGPAANARRVRIFVAEKGVDLETVTLDVRSGAQYEEPFNTMNPFHCVPFLELDDSTVIAESISICRYIEELYPEPSLFGSTAKDRARIDMWNRRVELDGFYPGLHAIRNSVVTFAGRVVPGTRNSLPQLPAIAERGREMLEIFLGRIEPHLGETEFLSGPAFSIADITGLFVINTATTLGISVGEKFPNVQRWHNLISARPSVDA